MTFPFWIMHIIRCTMSPPMYSNMNARLKNSICLQIGWVSSLSFQIASELIDDRIFVIRIQITELPRQLFLCHGLKVLDISDNDLSSIPTALSALVNIRKINLARNCKYFFNYCFWRSSLSLSDLWFDISSASKTNLWNWLHRHSPSDFDANCFFSFFWKHFFFHLNYAMDSTRFTTKSDGSIEFPLILLHFASSNLCYLSMVSIELKSR